MHALRVLLIQVRLLVSEMPAMNEPVLREVQYGPWWGLLILLFVGLGPPALFAALARRAGREDRRGTARVLLGSAG